MLEKEKLNKPHSEVAEGHRYAGSVAGPAHRA